MFTNDELSVIGLALLTRIDFLSRKIEEYGTYSHGVDWAGQMVAARNVYENLYDKKSDLLVH